MPWMLPQDTVIEGGQTAQRGTALSQALPGRRLSAGQARTCLPCPWDAGTARPGASRGRWGGKLGRDLLGQVCSFPSVWLLPSLP